MVETTTLETIRRNIHEFGCHVYIVTGITVPRFAYTVGLRESLGIELVMAGGIYYNADEVREILESARCHLKRGASSEQPMSTEKLGVFSFRRIHSSWSEQLLLGARDYYGTTDVEALQLVPDQEHWTIDIPNLAVPWNAQVEPAWQWLREPRVFPVSRRSTVTTNLDALRGKRVTEVTRWEDDEWEMFAGAGPDVQFSEARVVPLGSMVAIDPTLQRAFDLQLGAGLWRDGEEGEWNKWEAGSASRSDVSQ
ncbi:MAG TPA: DUF4262 domain-containing protein [Polyangiaceae bacterium]|nr:DUF4262 domain-containing protein [Polyangiaceae bacterium]